MRIPCNFITSLNTISHSIAQMSYKIKHRLNRVLLYKTQYGYNRFIITEMRYRFLVEDHVLMRIKELLEFNHWSLYKLAKEADLPYSSISNLFNRNTCPSIPTLEKICTGFRIGLSEFFDFSSNPLRNDGLTEEQQDLLNAYQVLSVKDKELLTAYMRGLLKK